MESARNGFAGRAFSYIAMLRATFTLNYLAFLLMRITGIALAFFLFLHLWTIGQIHRGESGFNGAMAAYDNPPGWVMEYLLLLAVLYHMLNGLRLIAADFLNLTERQKEMLILAGTGVAIAGAASISVFFPGIFPIGFR